MKPSSSSGFSELADQEGFLVAYFSGAYGIFRFISNTGTPATAMTTALSEPAGTSMGSCSRVRRLYSRAYTQFG